MSLYDKILKIQYDNGVNASEFITKTGLSRSLYYSIKDGDKKTLRPEQSKLIADAFPNVTLEWLSGLIQNDTLKNNNGSETIIKSNLSQAEINEIAYKVVTNEEAFMNVKAFSNIIEVRVAKRLQQIMSNKESYLEWLKE